MPKTTETLSHEKMCIKQQFFGIKKKKKIFGERPNVVAISTLTGTETGPNTNLAIICILLYFYN